MALLSGCASTPAPPVQFRVVKPARTIEVNTFAEDGVTLASTSRDYVEEVTAPITEADLEGSKWNRWCFITPGCRQETAQINGKTYTTRSQNGFNALNFVFPSEGTSVATLIRTEAAAGKTDAEAEMVGAVAGQIEEGQDMTSAILALRAGPGNIAASVGEGSKASSRVDVYRQRRIIEEQRYLVNLTNRDRAYITRRHN